MQSARACLYHATREMSDALDIKRGFFLHAKILLNDTNLLDQVVSRDIRGRGTSANTARKVLNHILHRTLPYNKLLEHVTARQIAGGMVSLSLSDGGVHPETIRRALQVLVREGYLIMLTTSVDRNRVYALNLPVIVEKIKDYLASGRIKPGTTAAKQKKRAEVVGEICKRLQPWYDLIMRLGELVLYQLDTFLVKYRDWCRRRLNLMGTARQIVKTVKEKKREARLKRLRRAAEKPLYVQHVEQDETQEAVTLYPRRGLDYWRLMVELRNDRYKGGIPIPTGKTIGQMKNWLRELKDVHEMDDHAIKEWIENIVDHWDRLAGWHFQTGEKGWHRVVPPNPDFGFYYAHRREMDPQILNRIEVSEQIARMNRDRPEGAPRVEVVKF